jgi:hypothetical protein
LYLKDEVYTADDTAIVVLVMTPLIPIRNHFIPEDADGKFVRWYHVRHNSRSNYRKASGSHTSHQHCIAGCVFLIQGYGTRAGYSSAKSSNWGFEFGKPTPNLTSVAVSKARTCVILKYISRYSRSRIL